MSLPEQFITIDAPSTGEYKDRGSKFLAFAFPVRTEAEAKEQIKKLKQEHYSAAHVCWAFVLGYGAEFEKSSDDREPSGTAGKPILRTLVEKKLTNVLVAVVRYFGGKLLGVPGLIQAYSEASQNALDAAGVLEKRIFHRVFQPCDFERQHEVIRICKQGHLRFYPDVFELLSGITMDIAPGQIEKIETQFTHAGFEKWKEIQIIDV